MSFVDINEVLLLCEDEDEDEDVEKEKKESGRRLRRVK